MSYLNVVKNVFYELQKQFGKFPIKKEKNPESLTLSRFSMTCVRRFELPTPWSVAKCSIQLSYTHISASVTTFIRNALYNTIYSLLCQYFFDKISRLLPLTFLKIMLY